MTVGIAAICQEESDPKVVLAADRMITTGQNPQIEYEHTRSKIQSLWENDDVTCMAVASGTVSFIESFLANLTSKLEDHAPTSVEQIAENGRNAYTELGRRTVENQILSKFDLDLADLTGGDPPFEPKILANFLKDVADGQERFKNRLEVLIAGIDGFGAHIYSLQNFDLDPQNTIGYHAIGSGNQPARSVFIRNQHDTTCDIERGIIHTIEAKRQSEEARGVGAEMDIALVNHPEDGIDCCHTFGEDLKGEWIDFYDDIKDAEERAREETIRDADIVYKPGTIHEDH